MANTMNMFNPPTIAAAGQRIFPVFLVVDTSYSMEGDRLAAAQTLAPTLIDACLEDPSVKDKVRVELIEFNSAARVVIPSAKATDVRKVPALKADGGTDYGVAFSLLRERIEEVCLGIKTDGFKVLRPAVFFISDGEPMDRQSDRDYAFARLADPAFAYRPNLCMFGVGDAQPEFLSQYRIGKGEALLVSGDAAAGLRKLIPLITKTVVATVGAAAGPDDDPFILDTSRIDDIDDIYRVGS